MLKARSTAPSSSLTDLLKVRTLDPASCNCSPERTFRTPPVSALRCRRAPLRRSELPEPDVAIAPVLTCDPRKNLGPNQYLNPSCFTLPTPGHNGTFVLPEQFGPGFF